MMSSRDKLDTELSDSARSAESGHSVQSEVSSRRAASPEEDPSSSATPANGEAQAAGQASKRVLVVDDNEDAAELLREILSCLGHRVEVAYDGATALEVAKAFRPEVALLDIGMPVMNGYELAALLRQSDLPTPRLIAITGYGAEAVAGEEGFDRHLMKPFDVNQLRDLIAEPPRR